VQGWLMQDRFMMRGALGIPYEFLWAIRISPDSVIFWRRWCFMTPPRATCSPQQLG